MGGSLIIIYHDDGHIMALIGRCVEVQHGDVCSTTNYLQFMNNPVWKPVQDYQMSELHIDQGTPL